MSDAPLLGKRFKCYNNFKKLVFLHFLFLFLILSIISFQLIILVKLTTKLENLDLTEIFNNSNFDYLTEILNSAYSCLDNKTCVKNFIKEIEN